MFLSVDPKNHKYIDKLCEYLLYALNDLTLIIFSLIGIFINVLINGHVFIHNAFCY